MNTIRRVSMGVVVNPQRPFEKKFASFTKAVWFLLGMEGGRWTVGEILDTIETNWPRNAARYQIGDMAATGLLARFEDPERGLTYGVTRACKIPRGLTLAEIEQLTGIRFVDTPCARATSESAAA